jgi:hypothetical protein
MRKRKRVGPVTDDANLLELLSRLELALAGNPSSSICLERLGGYQNAPWPRRKGSGGARAPMSGAQTQTAASDRILVAILMKGGQPASRDHRYAISVSDDVGGLATAALEKSGSQRTITLVLSSVGGRAQS